MALIAKNKKIIVEPEKQFWEKAIKLAKTLDGGGAPKKTEELSFPNLETFRRTLTPRKLQIIREIKHTQPESIYELARIMKIDYKNLIKDVNKLRIIGLIGVKKERTSEKRNLTTPVVSFDSLEVKIPV